jgi:acyl-homoserine-lactone acylase
MALTFSEGSIGGDIEAVNLQSLQEFYGGTAAHAGEAASGKADLMAKSEGSDDADDEPRGSNGMAIAPQNTKAGRSLLLINPHTSFFFREELQTTSDEGLNAYGASTWGQFFIYQRFQ